MPERLEPPTVPLAATLVGVMAPNPSVNEPLVVIGDPDTVIPLLPVAPTEVTVPLPPAPLVADVILPNASTVMLAAV